MTRLHSISKLLLVTVFMTVTMGTAVAQTTSSDPVIVEEIQLNKPDNAQKAAEAWDKTKTKTKQATTTAVEFSKEHGTKALNATKKGVTKGAEAVADGSKKAWTATKKGTTIAVDATVGAVNKAGKAIGDALNSDDQAAPVTDRSVSEGETNN